MRMVIGVDWSEEAFAAVQQATTLYLPQEVTFAHGVDLGIFQHPIVAEVANLQGYDEFRKARYEAGHQLMEQTATMTPPEVPSVKKACEFAKPATLVLETAAKAAADIIAVGGGGRGRMTELLLGSVSHRIALHATCTTLIVKGSSKQIRHVLVAIEDRDDAARMTRLVASLSISQSRRSDSSQGGAAHSFGRSVQSLADRHLGTLGDAVCEVSARRHSRRPQQYVCRRQHEDCHRQSR